MNPRISNFLDALNSPLFYISETLNIRNHTERDQDAYLCQYMYINVVHLIPKDGLLILLKKFVSCWQKVNYCMIPKSTPFVLLYSPVILSDICVLLLTNQTRL